MPLVPLPHQGLAGSPRTGQYYQHSGVISPGGVLAAAALGAAAAAIMAVPYALAVRYLPEIKLRGLFCVAFALALGAVPAAILKRFKVRNLPVSLAVIGVVALTGLYGSWVAWEAILVRDAPGHLSPLARAVRPDAVVALAVRLNEVGTWGLAEPTGTGTEPEMTKGTFLAILWLGEAATLLGGALLVGRAMLRTLPFCDACNRWCDGPTVVRTTAPAADPQQVRQRLEAGDFAYPSTLGPATPAGFLEFAKHTCGGCGRLNTLTVASRTVVRDKKGKVRQARRRVLVDKLLVTPADLQRLAPPAGG